MEEWFTPGVEGVPDCLGKQSVALCLILIFQCLTLQVNLKMREISEKEYKVNLLDSPSHQKVSPFSSLHLLSHFL